jgi:predicted metal-dependent phosphoesterase TrpH
VNKQRSYRFNVERFKVKAKEQHHAEIKKRFAVTEDLHAVVDINSVWETIRENNKISAKDSPDYYEWKKHKPWFDKGSK